uniref:DNA-binding response regulator n=1 Tax=Cryptomonas sp. SAG 977-2f TaxID=279061 RepID=A0A679CAQ8_9CRYP|nr:DNA-binding response regulator [Cryptomonas sp. SAG 977-2f]
MIKAIMVDREQKLLFLTKKYFSNKKIHVKTASSVTKALYFLNNSCPDVLIIDIVLSFGEGENFIENLQHDIKLKHIPTIFLTARGLTEDRIKGYKSGCNIYLSKPFDPEELESIIINIVEKTKLSSYWMSASYTIIRQCKNVLHLKKIKQLNFNPKIALTPKEKIVLVNILGKRSTCEIAIKLGTTERHIEQYITRILDKTMRKDTTELYDIPWYKLL